MYIGPKVRHDGSLLAHGCSLVVIESMVESDTKERIDIHESLRVESGEQVRKIENTIQLQLVEFIGISGHVFQTAFTLPETASEAKSDYRIELITDAEGHGGRNQFAETRFTGSISGTTLYMYKPMRVEQHLFLFEDLSLACGLRERQAYVE